MGYTMLWLVDGACRRSGEHGAIGAAAALEKRMLDEYRTMTQRLPPPTWFNDYTIPTNQRAEIAAIILALRGSLARCPRLDTSDIAIYSDSRYAVDCMNEWVYKWSENGWTNAAGDPVKNQDLIKEASYLNDEVKRFGTVTYKWIPREQNHLADEACNRVLDEMEDDY